MVKYTDYEALMRTIDETVVFTVREGTKLPTAEMRGANKVIDRIKSAPAADVVEVKHGEWIWNTEDKYKCSHCHYTTRVDEVMGLPQYKYCPNCGAKMDKRSDTE